MIKWDNFKFNQELSVTITDEEIDYELKVKIVEYEYNFHRLPYIADVKILESNNIIIYPLDSIMRLPIETSDYINFLLFAPIDKAPAREFKRKGRIMLN
jgi:hypothetical protein